MYFLKKWVKKRKTKKKNNPLGGLGKLASFTSESIGSAYDLV